MLHTRTGNLAGSNFYYEVQNCGGIPYAASYWSYGMFRNSGKNYGGDTMSPIVISCQSYQPAADGSPCVNSTDCPTGVVTVHEITNLPFTVPVALPLSFE